ncbi:MAG: mercury methylation corrinoid protein HgcA [Deferrisomatales bacterium]
MEWRKEESCCVSPLEKGEPREEAAAEPPCCTPAALPCCPPAAQRERPGYRLWPFVERWLDTPAGPVPAVRTRLVGADRLGRWLMRWGIGRDRYRIAPGLYAVGAPDRRSPVLVTANYKMTFDALRRELGGLDAWILVLETQGINVWCAAGKGTFGTDELVRRVEDAGIERVVEHRTLVLPQLGAPGVSAHQVRRRCGFSVVYGPVRAADLRAFLAAGGKAAPAMRRITFSTAERLALTPVELTGAMRPLAWTALALFVLGGIGPGFFSFGAAWSRGAAALGFVLVGLVAGAVLTPVALPWLPWRAFSAKGALVGAGCALAALWWGGGDLGALDTVAALLAVPAVASYCAMNFTGATPFTSPSGVEREMRRALPFQLGAVALAGLLWVAGAFVG